MFFFSFFLAAKQNLYTFFLVQAKLVY